MRFRRFVVFEGSRFMERKMMMCSPLDVTVRSKEGLLCTRRSLMVYLQREPKMLVTFSIAKWAFDGFLIPSYCAHKPQGKDMIRSNDSVKFGLWRHDINRTAGLALGGRLPNVMVTHHHFSI